MKIWNSVIQDLMGRSLRSLNHNYLKCLWFFQTCHIPITRRHWGKISRIGILLILHGLLECSPTSDAFDRSHLQKVLLFAPLAGYCPGGALGYRHSLDCLFRPHQPLLGQSTPTLHLGLTSDWFRGFCFSGLLVLMVDRLSMLRNVPERRKLRELLRLRKFHRWTTHATFAKWTHTSATAPQPSQHKWIQFRTKSSVLSTSW